MNGLLYDSYWTIHITPESHCSYASFETNIRMSNYDGLLKAVLAIFRPRKWTMTLFADTNGMKAIKQNPFHSLLAVPVIESTSRAIMGPCVISCDAFGNSSIDFKSPTSPGGAPFSPLATGSLSDTSAADGAAEIPSADFLADALIATISVPQPYDDSKVAAPIVSSQVEESKVPTQVKTRKGAISYLMSTKSQTEFIGEYSAVLGNFSLVHTATNTTARDALIAASEAVKDLAVPRAKYVVAKRVQALQNRIRTESC
jgi:hypothetical protein